MINWPSFSVGCVSGLLLGVASTSGVVYIFTTPPSQYIWNAKKEGKINDSLLQHEKDKFEALR
jgi:hypothetical protein